MFNGYSIDFKKKEKILILFIATNFNETSLA